MAREQDRLTLLFAHLQNSPQRGSIPGYEPGLLLFTPTCPKPGRVGWEQKQTESSEPRGIHQTKCFRVRENGTRRGQGMDVDTSPVLTSEEDAEGIGGLSPIAEPACCSHLLWAPVMDRQDRHWFTLQGHTCTPSSHLRQPNPMGWASVGAQTRLHSSWEQWRYFFPSTDAVVNLLAMYNVRFAGGSQFV